METTMKIEYRRQGDNSIGAWQPLTNLDGLIWDGVYALRVTADDGTSGLPFCVDDNDSMTFVVKDHAHDGSLQNNRTIVQTITRVEHSTGKVFVYNRTRHYSNGSHSWNSWELACDENGHPTFENNTVQQVEKNKNDIANEIIRAKSMDEGLDARVTANTTAISNEINRAQNVEQNIKNSLRCTTPRVYIGGLQENGDPYPGTSYSAYSAPVTGNGEIVVSDGYCIDAIKMFAKDGTALSYNNYNGQSYTFDDSYDYQFSFRRKDNGKFTADELKRVVQSLILDTIVWGADKDLNNYRCAGEYHIDGKRENTADNMPIYNIGNINARLTVLDAGGCVTQVLTLLNIGGGDSNIYTRTMQNGTWSMWNKLQSNVEVGAIGLGQTRTFDHLTDNGMYSGVNVYATGTDDNGYPITAFETFVLITINAYLTGGGVSQLKYSLLPDGTTCVAKRSKQENTWSEWNDLDTVTTARIQDGAVTAQKLASEVVAQINNNTAAITAEQNRAIKQEGLLNSAFEAETQRAVQAEADAVEKGKQLALRSLFVAAGAEYNDSGADITKTAPWGETVTHKAGHYYLNGLGDITEAQMMKIYNRGYLNDNDTAALGYSNGGVNRVRTNLCRAGMWNCSLPNYICVSNTTIEIVNLHITTSNVILDNCIITFSDSESLFHGASKLAVIDTRCLLYSPLWKNSTFKGCQLLREVRINTLKSNISFADAPLLSKRSVQLMIEKSIPTTTITITLHPDAYARLANDTDIVAALEAQPLVSLVSA